MGLSPEISPWHIKGKVAYNGPLLYFQINEELWHHMINYYWIVAKLLFEALLGGRSWWYWA